MVVVRPREREASSMPENGGPERDKPSEGSEQEKSQSEKPEAGKDGAGKDEAKKDEVGKEKADKEPVEVIDVVAHRLPAKRHPRLSDEERKVLWRKAVMEKARQIKRLTDVMILAMLALAVLAHLLPFVRVNRGKPQEWSKRGYAVMLDLLKPYDGVDGEFREEDEYWARVFPEPPGLVWGVQPRMLYAQDPRDGRPLHYPDGRRIVQFRAVYPATVFAYFILLVPVGAVALLVLYLLDYKLWMGRALPVASCVYGFASVLYLMIARVGAWNALRYAPAWAWYPLIIPLFLIGSFSMLRLVVSQRWKRYVWAGLEIPEHLKPPEPEEGEAEGEAKHERALSRAAAKERAQAREKKREEEPAPPAKEEEAKESEKAEQPAKASPEPGGEVSPEKKAEDEAEKGADSAKSAKESEKGGKAEEGKEAERDSGKGEKESGARKDDDKEESGGDARKTDAAGDAGSEEKD